MGKHLSNEYGQKPLNSAKKYTTDAINTASKRAVQRTVEATGDLIGNKITDKITSVLKKSPKKLQNELYLKTDKNEANIPKGRYISPEKYNKLLMN